MSVLIESPYATFYERLIVTDILSRTVSREVRITYSLLSFETMAGQKRLVS